MKQTRYPSNECCCSLTIGSTCTYAKIFQSSIGLSSKNPRSPNRNEYALCLSSVLYDRSSLFSTSRYG